MRRTFLFAVALGLTVPGPAWPDVLRPALSQRSWYGESFTFIADLDDTSYVQLTLSFTNIGPGAGKGICRVLVVGPSSAVFKESERVSRKEWSHEAGPEERLSVGPCVAWSGETAGAEAVLGGGKVRLTFADRLHRRGPLSTVEVGSEHFASEMLLLRGRVEAEIALPHEAARHLSGAAYVDHSRGTVAPKDLARRWVRFRALRSPRGLFVLGREGQDGSFSPVWACDEAARCHDLASFAVRREGSGLAAAFEVKLRGGGEAIDARSGTLLYRDAPVEDLGLLGHIVAPIVGSPVTWVYRGTALVGDTPPIEGILEVELTSGD